MRSLIDIKAYGLEITSPNTFLLEGEVNDKMLGEVIQYTRVYTSTQESVNICLNSGGGDLAVAWSIHDYLSALKSPVNIIVVGTASSAASVILQAGAVRAITKNSYVMIHQGHLEVQSGLSIADKKAWKRLADHHTHKMAELYAECMNLTISQVKRLIKTDQIFIGYEAVEAGLCDIVI
jgi:ATP-dependent protease ClpP protease subunit